MSRLPSVACAVLVFTVAASARSKEIVRDRGVLTEMHSVSCGTVSKTGSSVAGVLITGSSHTRSSELLCQEYVLKTPRVTYRIRPREEKHPVLLRVGDDVEFRLKKDEMLVRVPDEDKKERQYIVVSMIASPEFTAELNETQPAPRPHGKKLSIDPDPSREPTSVVPQNAVAEKSAPRVAMTAAAEPASPSLKIDSSPSGAEIFIDSASAGHTPAIIPVSPGTHSIQVVMAGYEDWVTNVKVGANSQQQVTANLTR
jgi:PEGA domain